MAEQRKRGARGERAVRETRSERSSSANPSRAARAPTQPAGSRKVDAAVRREAILDAALTVFAEHGFEAARLDDMAARAGVAKGTLYLYFKDKEALFEALVRGAVSPMLDKVGEFAAAPGMKPLDVLEFFFLMFQKEVLGTKRKLLLRLIIAEGPRFPSLAEFYYREVVAKGLELIRSVVRKGVANGEFASDALERFPQLIVAPLLMSVIWDGLFSKIDPLDVPGLLQAHRELLTAGRPKS